MRFVLQETPLNTEVELRVFQRSRFDLSFEKAKHFSTENESGQFSPLSGSKESECQRKAGERKLILCEASAFATDFDSFVVNFFENIP